MAGLCWMTVMLTVLLSAGDRADAVDSADAVDLETLASYVNQISALYGTHGTYSLAVSIPLPEMNRNKNKKTFLADLLKKSDPVERVKDKLDKDEVYVGTRVVASKFQEEGQHAESRVVDNLVTLFNNKVNKAQDMLLFYAFTTPCGKCFQLGSTGNNLDRYNQIRLWQSYAAVFSEVFQPRDKKDRLPDVNMGAAIQLFGNYQGPRGQIGLDHIFRCMKPEGSKSMVCISCDNGNQVADQCFSDED
ncbi:uncharacterized protein LOC117535190 [Gymnodraco acuticeps]|uniref:Uncharacterized protein LOC117535190 n=1 Tax=Gymnodraco acuticeps TaxID=8218 RepID=A0A6P8SXR2_GYMAC|nr:uncharacterized protein LOC117535190 [Gymnodraco acuticeps]